MPYVDMKKLVTEVAKARGWNVVSKGITKRIDDQDSGLFGINMTDVEQVVQDLKVGDSLDELRDAVGLALDRMEGTFVLLSMGYQVYEEDE